MCCQNDDGPRRYIKMLNFKTAGYIFAFSFVICCILTGCSTASQQQNSNNKNSQQYTTGQLTGGSLFATGNLHKLNQTFNSELPFKTLDLDVPSDAEERMKRFEARNSKENIEKLCRELYRVLIPGTPGLEQFE
ncbi:MAG TPA: hypothetical protein DCY35_09475, partial [Prolixibacteraceae bacterium]|nr:hypothetical protein [Prolixibacteraceae bacterium]